MSDAELIISRWRKPTKEIRTLLEQQREELLADASLPKNVNSASFTEKIFSLSAMFGALQRRECREMVESN